MAEIFDASGVGGGGAGFDFTRAINATLDAFKTAAEKLIGSAHDLSHSATQITQATTKLAGPGAAVSGGHLALNTTELEKGIYEIGSILEEFGKGKKGVYGATFPGLAGGPGAVEGGRAAGGGFAGVGAILGALSAGFLAATAAITGLVAAAHHFVGLVNPATVQNFDLAMRDLGAVIGTFLVPVLTEATALLREFAAYLYPLVLQALPGFRAIIGGVGDVLSGFMPILANLGAGFVDLFGYVGEIAKSIADLVLPTLRAFSAIMAGLVPAIKSALGAIFGIFGGELKNQIKSFGELLGLATIALAGLTFQFLGMNDALQAMIADLQKGPAKLDATGLAVATNARFTDPGSLGKELAQRAFVTTGREGAGGPKDDMVKFRELAVGVLGDIRSGELTKKLAKAIVDAMIEALMSRAEKTGIGGVLSGLNPMRVGNALSTTGIIQLFLDEIL